MTSPAPKVCIITGASSGIGRASAIALSNVGWSIVLTARNESNLKETASLCRDGTPMLLVPGDVTQESHIQDLFAKTLERFGRLDLLFNNAGITGPRVAIEEITPADFQACLAVNLSAAFLCTQLAIKTFKSQTPSGGRIINNASLAAHVPRPNMLAYTCSKHAIAGLTKTTSLEGRAFDIACTQPDVGKPLVAGNAMTPMVETHAQGVGQPDGSILKEGTCDVRHVADAVVHIASLPNTVNVLEMTIMANNMPYVGRG